MAEVNARGTTDNHYQARFGSKYTQSKQVEFKRWAVDLYHAQLRWRSLLDFNLTEFAADRNDPHGYRELLVARRRHYPVRVGIGVVIFVCQLITVWPHFSRWPPIWLAAIVLIQTLETLMDRHILAKYVTVPKIYRNIGVALAAFSSFIYCA